MKVRTDFVTNSSSSSFILGFTSEDSIKHELFDGFPEWALDRIETVLSDVLSAERITKDDVLKEIEEYLEWHEAYCIAFNLQREMQGFDKAIEYLETPEGKRRVEEQIKKKIEEYKKKIEGKDIFVEVEYSDNGINCGGVHGLEFDIMPKVKSVITVFNNH